jgi:asparagine synthetase B (glutamine-hydrolysing)
MCGILFTVKRKGHPFNHVPSIIGHEIAKRGPDALRSIGIDLVIPHSNLELDLEFTSSVLALRGHGIVTQPLRDRGQILCWNGQVFRGLDVGKHENDTLRIWEQVCNGQNIVDILGRVEGP